MWHDARSNNFNFDDGFREFIPYYGAAKDFYAKHAVWLDPVLDHVKQQAGNYWTQSGGTAQVRQKITDYFNKAPPKAKPRRGPLRNINKGDYGKGTKRGGGNTDFTNPKTKRARTAYRRAYVLQGPRKAYRTIRRRYKRHW